MDRLMREEHFLHVPLQIGDGDELGEHGNTCGKHVYCTWYSHTKQFLFPSICTPPGCRLAVV